MGPGAQTARLMLYGLLAVVLMAMDHRGQYVSRARDLAQYAVEPVYHLVEWPVSALRNLFGQLPGLNLVIYGVVLVLIVMFMPRGLAGLWSSLRARWNR